MKQGALDDTAGQSISTLHLLQAIQADKRDLPDDRLYLLKRRTQGHVGTAAEVAAVIPVAATTDKDAIAAASKRVQGGNADTAAAAADPAQRVTETQAACIRVALVCEIAAAKQESERGFKHSIRAC